MDMAGSQAIYRVKLHLSLQRGLMMSICSSVVQETPSDVAAPSLQRMTRFRRFLWVIALGIAAGMSGAYLLPQNLRNTNELYVFAAVVSFFARVFQLHIALAAGGVAIVALLVRARRLATFSALTSLVLLIPTIASLLPRSAPAAASPAIRVMSINLLKTNRDIDAILRQIRETNPDIIAFQEHSTWSEELLSRELADYPYRLTDPRDDSAAGAAIFSKLPMSGQVQQPHDRLGVRERLRAVVTLGGREVVLYAIHPCSPHRYSNVLRNRLQAADLTDELRKEPLPVIVAGDFNATELTPNLEAFSVAGLTNTHDLAGSGRGATWPDTPFLRDLPGFRIDHILISRQLTCTRSQVGGPTGSDHRPIFADVAFAR
jgi:endonuclease/exonuclease/phosphatase (EEP) superfamily protein YafD